MAFFMIDNDLDCNSGQISLDIELFRNIIWSNYDGVVTSIEKGANVNSRFKYPYIVNKHPTEKKYDDFKLKYSENSYINIDVKVYSVLEYAKLRVNDQRIIDYLIEKGA